jgi:hypothetical protein
VKFSGKLVMSFSMIVIAVGVIITAAKWPFKTALFPMVVSIFLLFGASADFLLNVFGSKAGASKERTMDFQLSEDIDSAVATRRTLVAFSWIIGFFLLILLFGFLISVPAVVLLFLKFQAKERWGISLALAGLALGFFYILFIRLLDIPFSPGWAFEGLKMLGVGI